METLSKFEVRCPRCNVSFPIGTKVCLHCGGRTGPSFVGVPDARPAAGDYSHRSELIRTEDLGEMEGAPPLEMLVEAEAEEVGVAGQPSKLRSLATLLWVLLAIGISLVRACSEEG